jgi:hypothetical protein
MAVLPVLAAPAQATFPGQNGKIVFQRTDDSADHDEEIWTMNPEGSGAVKLTDNSVFDVQPAWSPDGRLIAFASKRDGQKNYDIYVMKADGSGTTRITTNFRPDSQPAWAPGSDRIAFTTNRFGSNDVYSINLDGSGETQLTTSSSAEFNPSWSYDGSKIFYTAVPGGIESGIWAMNPDGSGQELWAQFCHCNHQDATAAPDRVDAGGTWWTTYYLPSGDTNTEYHLFTNQAGDEVTACDWSGSIRPCSGYYGPLGAAWSPEGTMIAHYESAGSSAYPDLYEIWVDDIGGDPIATERFLAYGSNPDWQPVNPGYARPLAATPSAVQLVPAQKPCGTPNGSHNGPLTAPSCSPALQSSDYLTVGGADGQTTAARFRGFIDFKVLTGNPATFADEADLRFVVKVDDVRRRSDYLDYEGELLISLPLRITDRWNGPSLNQAGTASDLPLSFAVPCSATADTTIGSTCSITTTADSIAPGAIREGRRSNMELGQVQVYDGGSDGDGDTTGDNTLFMTQGLFAP